MISDTSQNRMEKEERQKNDKGDGENVWEDLELDDENALEGSDCENGKSCNSKKNENTFSKNRDCQAKQHGSELSKRLLLKQMMPGIVDGKVIRQKMLETELKTQKEDFYKALLRAQRVIKSTQARQGQLTCNCTEEEEEEPGDIVTVL